MQAALHRFRSADWRLQLYALLVPVFWLLALAPGWAREAGLQTGWEGALINCLLLVPLIRRRSMWPVTLLGLWTMCVAIAMWMTVFTGNGGHSPWNPEYAVLALLAGGQFVLLFSFDLGYRLNAEDAEKRGARTPARPRRPRRT